MVSVELLSRIRDRTLEGLECTCTYLGEAASGYRFEGGMATPLRRSRCCANTACWGTISSPLIVTTRTKPDES